MFRVFSTLLDRGPRITAETYVRFWWILKVNVVAAPTPEARTSRERLMNRALTRLKSQMSLEEQDRVQFLQYRF